MAGACSVSYHVLRLLLLGHVILMICCVANSVGCNTIINSGVSSICNPLPLCIDVCISVCVCCMCMYIYAT